MAEVDREKPSLSPNPCDDSTSNTDESKEDTRQLRTTPDDTVPEPAAVDKIPNNRLSFSSKVGKAGSGRTTVSGSLRFSSKSFSTSFKTSTASLVIPDHLKVPEGAENEENDANDATSLENTAFFCTRDNSDYMWQQTLSYEVFGALEVNNELDFDYNAPLRVRSVPEKDNVLKYIIGQWGEMNIQEEFREACKAIPPQTSCCGMIRNDDATIIEMAKLLNKGWIKSINHRLKVARQPFKLDAFVWTWFNATGKAKTNILLIRFLSSKRKSLDF